VKAILADFNLNPEPTIIEVDTREDAKILAPMLARLTSFPELPILLIGGNVVGSTEQVKILAKNGELQKMITTAGGQIDGQRKKKSKK
jgi:glutaredoxin-related protein